jgi:hypothetical protein
MLGSRASRRAEDWWWLLSCVLGKGLKLSAALSPAAANLSPPNSHFHEIRSYLLGVMNFSAKSFSISPLKCHSYRVIYFHLLGGISKFHVSSLYSYCDPRDDDEYSLYLSTPSLSIAQQAGGPMNSNKPLVLTVGRSNNYCGAILTVQGKSKGTTLKTGCSTDDIASKMKLERHGETLAIIVLFVNGLPP